MSALEILRQVFGYKEFRPGQEDIIKSLMSGRDALGVMPTGAGKSVCYQVPAVALPGLTVVISPLISLMKDQVDGLLQSGVEACSINSSMGWDEAAEALRLVAKGRCRLLYVAPERLESDFFQNFISSVKVSLLVVDEAHCISEWGHDFRPSYRSIARVVSRMSPRPPVGAFTATATPDVKRDITEQLQLQTPLLVTTGFDRPNLYFQVEHTSDRDGWTRGFISKNAGYSGIVYCATRKNVESTCQYLRDGGIEAVRYHAGLSDMERTQAQEAFIHDRVPVIVATNALGMGIDKSDVRYVIHGNMPKNMESYYQEAGRAGRDGAPATCVLLYSARDISTARYLINKSVENRTLELEKLQQIIGYCNTGRCLRTCILEYFGDRPNAQKCGLCSNCEEGGTLTDVTIEAKKILSCVYRLKEKAPNGHFGPRVISDVLRGSASHVIEAMGLESVSTWGIMKGTPRSRLDEIMNFLLADGYMALNNSTHLEFTKKSWSFLKSGSDVLMRARTRDSEPKPKRRASAVENAGLFEVLRALRKSIADEQGVPPFVVFSDATLHAMCDRLPSTPEEFLDVPGVGTTKLERYGDKFLSKINLFVSPPPE